MIDMPVPTGRGAYGLHVLVSRLDRSADRLLRERFGVSYPRYLLLLTVRRLGAVTQRALADELGITEPTVSRTVAALAASGLLAVTSRPGEGHRRSVDLTAAGRSLVDAAAESLEVAFNGLVAAAGVDAATLDGITERLLQTLDEAPPP